MGAGTRLAFFVSCRLRFYSRCEYVVFVRPVSQTSQGAHSMYGITVTIHAKSAQFGTLGEVVESSSFTTEDSRWGQFATFGDHLARPAAARLDLGGSRGSYAGGGTRSFSFDRGTVVIVATEIEAPAAEAEAVTAEDAAEIESVLQAAGPLVTAAGLPVCYSREDAAALHSRPAAAATHLVGNAGNAGNQPYTGVCGARGLMTTMRRQATCPACLEPAAAEPALQPAGGVLAFARRGDETAVTLDGVPIGRVVRQVGSDSSPRGRAYRTFHYPITPAGRRGLRCYTRREAVESLLRTAKAQA